MEMKEEAIVKELKANRKVNEWLKKFKHGDPERFLEAYAKAKIKMINDPEDFSIKERYRTDGHKLAEDALNALLGKKLFDLEVLWRAKEIEIEEVKLCVEMMNWNWDVYNCPFIPDITEEELQILSDYLNRPDFRKYDIDGRNHWFFDDIRERKEEDWRDAQKWFNYYDSKIKEKVSLDKPDFRKEKEDYYFNVYDNNLKEKKKEAEAKTKATKSHKDVDYKERFKILEIIAKDFGNTDYYKFLANRRKYKLGQHGYDTQYPVNYLKFFYNEEIPMQPNESWVQSIKQAYEGHMAKVAIAHLPEVVSMYRFKRENNMLDSKASKSFDDLVEKNKEYILKARKFLGEPENLEI